MAFDDVVEELKKVTPGRVTVVTYADMLFLYEIGALDWDFAGLLCFQEVIAEHGTLQEKRRLRAMNVGFWFDDGESRE